MWLRWWVVVGIEGYVYEYSGGREGMMLWVFVNVYFFWDLIVILFMLCFVNRGGREGGNGYIKGFFYREREREREIGFFC